MPLVESDYIPPPLLKNGHAQTIFASACRWVRGVRYERERIETADGDFLDLDWSRVGVPRLAILSHGLEGRSTRSYILGMVRALNRHGWDALAWNFRGCSGEPNRLARSYHSGATEDLEAVIRHLSEKYRYSKIALIGFSLGGNITLKYLGERGEDVPSVIKRSVAFSVPCHLESGAWQLAKRSNQIYMKRFLKMFRSKIREKKERMAGRLDDNGFSRIKTFKEFDDRYTAPLNGFKDAEDYWEKASSEKVLHRIRIPTLLVNAGDDPFLPEPCYPVEKARANPNFFLEIPDFGGHVGFIAFNRQGEYWSESRALAFINGGS